MNSVITNYCFPKASRLLHKKEFDALFRHAGKVKTGFLTILYSPNNRGIPRLGLMLAKRIIPTAIKRNRLKRLIREAFRQEQARIGPYDLVVMLQKNAFNQTDSTIVNGVSSALARITMLRENL